MSSREQQSNGEGSDNSNAWMVTFSDLVMLLLTFFVLLLTMSSLDQKAAKELISHLKNSTGVLEFTGLTEIGSLASFMENINNSQKDIMIDHETLSSMCQPTFDAVRQALGSEERMRNPLEISQDERGVSLSFHENIFFKSGMETISKESYALLDTIASAVADSPNDILIMGHTDKTPVKQGRYRSNLELSAYRGLAVLDYFINAKKLDADRFSVGGYGALRPFKPNNSLIGDPANRRVEIIFKPIREI